MSMGGLEQGVSNEELRELLKGILLSLEKSMRNFPLMSFFFSYLDEQREDCVADDRDGGLDHVGEEGGEGEAVGHVAAGAVPVHLDREEGGMNNLEHRVTIRHSSEKWSLSFQ